MVPARYIIFSESPGEFHIGGVTAAVHYNMPLQGLSQQIKIAYKIEYLMADKLVRESQVGINYLIFAYNYRIIEIAAFSQPHFPKKLYLRFKAESARRGDQSQKIIPGNLNIHKLRIQKLLTKMYRGAYGKLIGRKNCEFGTSGTIRDGFRGSKIFPFCVLF